MLEPTFLYKLKCIRRYEYQNIKYLSALYAAFSN